MNLVKNAMQLNDSGSITANVKNMKCTGLKSVSYPDTRMMIKGSTVKYALTPVYFIFGVRHSKF